MTLAIVPQFMPTAISGQGFIAIAAVIFGKWTPHGGYLACLLFGFAQALGIKFSAIGLDSNLASPIPYAVTIIGLVIFAIVRNNQIKKQHSSAALKN